MGKDNLRPKRIINGFAKAIINKADSFSDERMTICQSCELFTKKFCDSAKGGCGCFLPAKTKEIEEHCPMNKWNDIKFYKKEGIALVNLSTDKGKLLLSDNGFSFIFNDLKKGDNSEITLKVVNDRSDVMDNDLDLVGIKMSATCGCTVPKNYPNKLEEGDSFDFNITYDTNRVGVFNKTVTVKANNKSIFKIVINGKVNE